MFGADANWSTANGGAYQQVQVCPGADIEASVWIYTRQIGGQDYDVNARIGIDPTGGTDPNSTDIIWSSWYNSPDAWSQIGLIGGESVRAVGDTATLFIEHWHRWAISFNLTLFDEAEFVATGGSGALPKITLDPATLDPETTEGSSPPSGTFTVQNTGGGTLDYTIGVDQSWLRVEPASGSSTGEQDTVVVTYMTDHLAPGAYDAAIIVSDPGSSNTSQSVRIMLVVHESGVCTSQALVNGGFEEGLTGWIIYGDTDGLLDTRRDSVDAHGGTKMFGSSANWSVQTGGAYQRIRICTGAKVEASMWLYTRQIGGQDYDVNARIGIDPTGGTDPGSSSIVWSSWSNSPNRWSQLGILGNEAVGAVGDTITVFIAHWHRWPLQFNFTVMDDIDVIVSSGNQLR
jgi:hypothetical protein